MTGYELLEHVTAVLETAGLRAGEEYPGLEQAVIDTPRAVAGLLELDAAGGTARFRVRVLSPRLLGGWCCQVWAARVSEALTGAGMRCTAEEMAYLAGSDCFSVALTAQLEVSPGAQGWVPVPRRQILCGELELEGVESFTAARDQQRRLVGAHWEQGAVTVTPGRDGWKLELVQRGSREVPDPEEPFTLTVREGDREHRYTGCCWNETVWEYARGSTRLTRRGFALAREEESNG